MLKKLAGSHTENTFGIERSYDHSIRINLDGNKLANVRTDITNKKRLKDFEFKEIKERVTTDVKDIEGIRDGYVDHRDKGTSGVHCTDADTGEAMIKYVDQKENINHIRAVGDIPINEEFQLVGEANHNASYDTTGYKTIMFHPNRNETSLTNSNPKKLKSELIELEKKTIMLSIFRLETILSELSKK